MLHLSPLLWLLLLLGPFLFLQRRLHYEVQAVLLLLTRREDISAALFALLFFPGVLLHEGSHYLMAKLLRVPTGAFSLIPQSLDGNRLRLGFVETAPADVLRDALIGMAPLLTGGAFVAYAGVTRLGLLAVWDALARGNWAATLGALAASYASPDFWLWFYLLLTVSSTMFPSPSDRRAWLPVAGTLALIVALALLFGAGPWMSANLLPWLNRALQGVVIVFAISAAIHLAVWLPTWGLRLLLSRITGYDVV